MDSISLIITYYNEEKNIIRTLKKVFSQSLLPKELILINSGSTDKSKKLIDNFLKTKKNKNINIYNFSLDTNLPSTSKNMGVQVANYKLVAFLDCGLNFENNWLEKQLYILKKNKLDAVIGSVKLLGKSLFDKASVINTYGYKKITPCIPGSLIKKKIFNKLGYFEQSRSLYDVLWKKKLFNSNIKYEINNENSISYYDINYASNLKNLLQKSYLYSSDKINFDRNPRTFLYLSIPILIILLMLFNFTYLIGFAITYLIIRLLNIFLKSEFKSILNLKFLYLLVLTSLTIDIGRLCGSSKAFLVKIGINNIITLFLLIYFILFNTPLISLMANNLMVYSNIPQNKNYDAIVVFSGDGTTSYTNQTYRKRAVDAIEYSKKYEVKQIFLSSGKSHTISEVQLIKAYLKEQNVNKNIYVFQKFPSSTFENVILVGKKIESYGYKNIIFITAPYHYKRSISIWKKNFPELNIYSAKNVDFDHQKYKWIQNIDEIKITIYEHLAIFYYKFKGYL